MLKIICQLAVVFFRPEFFILDNIKLSSELVFFLDKKRNLSRLCRFLFLKLLNSVFKLFDRGSFNGVTV